MKRETLGVGGKEVGSLSDIAVCDEAKEVWPYARPQARKKPEVYSLEYSEDFFGPSTTQMVADRSPQ